MSGNIETADTAALERICRDLLLTIGEDPDRDGLRDTPRRWAAMWRDFVHHDAGRTDTLFQSGDADQMIVVGGIEVWSLCEHHLLPFVCDIAIGYIPKNGAILGLSKFGRIARKHSHRLQVQERLVHGIASEIQATVGTDDVAVYAAGLHLCMIMRGARMRASMRTSAVFGAFRKPEVRSEFFALVAQPGGWSRGDAA